MSIEPIRRRIRVRAAPGDAFRVFTAGLETWWPLGDYSLSGELLSTDRVVFEEHVGGRIFEVLSDGSEARWGRVVAWEPGRRVAIDWSPADDEPRPTRLDVTFEPALDGPGTVVTLEHTGWEALGERGAGRRERYATGWAFVFDERFGAAAGGTV
jgi:uncharacterized protein YndB with AHSA1/START domain